MQRTITIILTTAAFVLTIFCAMLLHKKNVVEREILSLRKTVGNKIEAVQKSEIQIKKLKKQNEKSVTKIQYLSSTVRDYENQIAEADKNKIENGTVTDLQTERLNVFFWGGEAIARHTDVRLI